MQRPLLPGRASGLGWAPKPGRNSSTGTLGVATPASLFTRRKTVPWAASPRLGPTSLFVSQCKLPHIQAGLSLFLSPAKASCASGPERTGRFGLARAAPGAGRLDKPSASWYLEDLWRTVVRPHQLLESRLLSSYPTAYT